MTGIPMASHKRDYYLLGGGSATFPRQIKERVR
jgi:hypothetical protein